eukprot:SAG22_NODE_124_length_18884_cov_34.149367_7_plen_697_part_00
MKAAGSGTETAETAAAAAGSAAAAAAAVDKPKLLDKIVLKYRGLDGVHGKLEPDPQVEWDPGMHPKSVLGAICTHLWVLIYLVLLCLLGWRFFDNGNTGAVPGDKVWLYFSHHCAGTDAELAEKLIKDDRPIMKIPTFMLRIDTKLTQFEADAPSLQKLDLIDDTGYFPHPLTSSPGPVPGVKSVVQSLKVPLNSFDERLSRVAPYRAVPAENIDDSYARAAAHRFTSETLKARYQALGIFEAGQPGYNHSAHLFACFRPDQLKNLKSCQLQVWLANAAEFLPQAATWARDLPGNRTVPSLTSDPYTWRPANWLDLPLHGKAFRHSLSAADYANLRLLAGAATGGGAAALDPAVWPWSADFNLLQLHKPGPVVAAAQPAAAAAAGAAGANSWVFGVSYANNFLHTIDKMTCAGAPLKEAGLDAQFAVAPTKTATTLNVLGTPLMGQLPMGKLGKGYVTAAGVSSGPLATPFFLLISGMNGKERVKVVGLNDCAPSPAVCQLAEWEFLGTDRSAQSWADEAACNLLTTEDDCYEAATVPTAGCDWCRLTTRRPAPRSQSSARPRTQSTSANRPRWTGTSGTTGCSRGCTPAKRSGPPAHSRCSRRQAGLAARAGTGPAMPATACAGRSTPTVSSPASRSWAARPRRRRSAPTRAAARGSGRPTSRLLSTSTSTRWTRCSTRTSTGCSARSSSRQSRR